MWRWCQISQCLLNEMSWTQFYNDQISMPFASVYCRICVLTPRGIFGVFILTWKVLDHVSVFDVLGQEWEWVDYFLEIVDHWLWVKLPTVVIFLIFYTGHHLNLLESSKHIPCECGSSFDTSNWALFYQTDNNCFLQKKKKNYLVKDRPELSNGNNL